MSTSTEIIITPDPTKTTRWAGGTTTELMLVPGEASYANRDFLFRISSATVEKDGPFTTLLGVNRLLMILSGKAKLSFGDGTVRNLASFDSLSFEGGMDVSCAVELGPLRDFNVMLREGASASLIHANCKPHDEINLEFPDLDTASVAPKGLSVTYFVYPVDAACLVAISGQNKPYEIMSGGAFTRTLPRSIDSTRLTCYNLEARDLDVVGVRITA